MGIINIVQKYDNLYPLSSEELETLTTITTLAGTAIRSAILYRETFIKQRLDQELKVAHSIQSKLLPKSAPVVPNIQFGILSVAAREIGGDYYDFIPLEHGCMGIVVADIVGKGIPAAMIMVMVKSILTTHISSILSPSEALTELNKRLCLDPVIQKFVPMFYAVLNPHHHSFTYSCAGHGLAILRRDRKITLLDTAGFPLGADPTALYEEAIIHLQPDDRIFLVTDGVFEARNAKGRLFGENRLLRLIRHMNASTVQEEVDILYDHLYRFTQSVDQSDDITILGIQMTAQQGTHDQESPLSTQQIQVHSDKTQVQQIRDIVSSFAQKMGFDHSSVFDLKLVVNEAHMNIIEHAYNGADDQDIVFHLEQYHDRLEIHIQNFGRPFSRNPVKGTEYLDELEGSGFGVFLISTLMDDISYETIPQKGNWLHLTKYVPW